MDRYKNNILPEAAPAYALQALNSCPGLLCFVVDKNGALIYATRGYREIARRFLGHECEVGALYPAGVSTPFEFDLRDIIQEAFLGGTSTASLEEAGANNSEWTVTGAPLMSAAGVITGAIVGLTPVRGHYWQYRCEKVLIEPAQSGESQAEFSPGFNDINFLDRLPGMFFVLDDNGFCVEANASFLSVMKLPREAIAGHPFREFLSKSGSADKDMADVLIKLLRGHEENWELECSALSSDGDVSSLSLSGTRLQWNGETCALIGCVDNTKLRRTEEQLKRVSTTDASTGILNRQGMERVLSAEIERVARYKGCLSMIIMDIDGFRGLNEKLGYSASDNILKDLAAALKSSVSLTDFLGRWGGDEFMVLTPAPLESAARLAEKLRGLAEQITFAGRAECAELTKNSQNNLTLSAGVAEFRKTMDVSSFVGSAYDAMIEAKKGGGNRVALAQEVESESEIL